MNVLDVYLNGRKLCRAGVGAHGVLNANVSWVRLVGPASRTARRLGRPVEETRLDVGGLSDRTHRVWVERGLVPGDRVAVVVASANTVDSPMRTEPQVTQVMEPETTTFLN